MTAEEFIAWLDRKAENDRVADAFLVGFLLVAGLIGFGLGRWRR